MRLLIAVLAVSSMAASWRTTNFVVQAPTEEIARKIAEQAEASRKEIAQLWLGYELPKWSRPCQVRVAVGRIGSGGVTTFSFDRNEVFNWNMNVQGTLERLLDSVVPHEVSHTIFACHFRRPLPRWADEGAATLIEHPSETQRQIDRTRSVVENQQRIPLRRLLSIMEYPQDGNEMLTLYAQGYTLCLWLVQIGGRERYLSFIEAGHRHGWDKAVQSHYSARSVEELEQKWLTWVSEGCRLESDAPSAPAVAETRGTAPRPAAAARAGRSRPSPEALILRAQNADPAALQEGRQGGEWTAANAVARAPGRADGTQAAAAATPGRSRAAAARPPRQGERPSDVIAPLPRPGWPTAVVDLGRGQSAPPAWAAPPDR